MSVWLGAALILLAIVGVRPVLPSFSWNGGSPGGLLSAENVLAAAVLGLLLMVLSATGLRLMGGDVRAFVVGFAVLFGLGWASQTVAGIPTLKE